MVSGRFGTSDVRDSMNSMMAGIGSRFGTVPSLAPEVNWRVIVIRSMLPTVCLAIGAAISYAAIRHNTLTAAAAYAAIDVNRFLFETIGWTWVLFLPITTWLLALVIVSILRTSTAVEEQLALVENLSPMIGLLGTIWALGEATRAMDDDNLAASVLSLAPAVGEALHSTIAGLSVAIVAFIFGCISKMRQRRGGGTGTAAIAGIVVLATAIGSPARAGAEGTEDLFSLPMSVGLTWDREAARAQSDQRAIERGAVGRTQDRAARAQRRVALPAAPSREELRRLIHLTAVREGMDPAFAEALAQTESNLNPRAISPTGCCRGLFQLHYQTAREMGVGDVFDPIENATGGIRYFRRMATRFQSIAVALIAYNAGPEVAKRWVADPRTPVPLETNRFVQHVVATYRQLQSIPQGHR